jgi:diacylglycerol O-acyltransferase
MTSNQAMSGVDAAWLHMDRPTNTADVVALMTFPDRVPGAAVERLLEEKLLRHPRFRQRVVPDGPLALASWGDDPAFSLRRHLSRRRLPGGGTRALERFASAVATEPLDQDHPLWRVYLVDGFGKGSAIVAKLHHCIADGFALVGLLLSMADEAPGDAAPVAAPATRSTGSCSTCPTRRRSGSACPS